MEDKDDLKYENIDTKYIFGHFELFSYWIYKMAKIKIYSAEEVINAGGLKPGDCLLSDGKREDEKVWDGHVEFYIDDDHSFGWGEVWDAYPKDQRINYKGTYFTFGHDKKKYEYVLRYIGEE